MRKIVLALAAAATLAGGLAAATAPAEAKVHVFLGFGTPGYYDPYYDPGYYNPGYYDPYYPDPYYVVHRRHHVHHPVRCKWVRAWHHHHWVTYKQCYRVRY
jgi:hypothetical protein